MHARPAQQHPTKRRPPEKVMRLSRLGSFHQSRLSFMRVLTRRMQREQWTFSRPVFRIDADGEGHAVFCAHGPTRTYSLIAFAHNIAPEQRSDRVIAEAWDATFTLFDGTPTTPDINRLAQQVPFQEAGRLTDTELTLSRANRSVRLWQHVVDSLACGRQPDAERLQSTGYLMRTTAVYGSGKFGAADRESIAERPEFAGPFQVEMLSVYLIRTFVRDLVQHMAWQQGGSTAVPLDPAIAGSLGIGNSTGLGMAPFIVNHPVLFNNWILAREEAIARVRAVPQASQRELDVFVDVLQKSQRSAEHWHTDHPQQAERIQACQRDLQALGEQTGLISSVTRQPWNQLFEWAETALSEEGQEALASLMLEPYGSLIDGLSECMASDSRCEPSLNGSMPLSTLMSLIESVFAWALKLDWSSPENQARVWYVSEEKLEPRLGERAEEPIEPYERPLAPARDAVRLYQCLHKWSGDATVAHFLLQHPEHRQSVHRVQTAQSAPYGEIRDNTISADLMPIDMLRCKLSFFGATHFDPRSDRWVRICLFRNAPYPEQLSGETDNGTPSSDADLWPYATA